MPLLMHDPEHLKLWDWRCRLALWQSEGMEVRREEDEEIVMAKVSIVESPCSSNTRVTGNRSHLLERE